MPKAATTTAPAPAPAAGATLPTTDPKPEAGAEPVLLKARVLTDCIFGKPDDVVEVTAAEAEAHAAQLDADPAAVAYAESLKA